MDKVSIVTHSAGLKPIAGSVFFRKFEDFDAQLFSIGWMRECNNYVWHI
ncbi:MAG: hypothetical protein M3R36_13590 [Bacteroidota bacterium]|nr:hypothetical protein [Bacteroidota bacterium]